MGGRANAGLAAAIATVLMLVIAPSASAETAADTGALRAEVDADPWRLTLTDESGAAVLAEHPGTDTRASGTVGFRTGSGWQHATRVLSSRRNGGAYLAELATTDPARTIAVRIAAAGEGEIAFEAQVIGAGAELEAVGIGFEARAGERYLGFGERSNAVAQSGVVENYVSDGPYQAEEYPFLGAFVPPWGLRERTDATYFPIPWLLSSSGYGVLVDNPETSYFRLGADSADSWSVEVVKAPEGETGADSAPPPDRIALRFFAGPEPADAVRRLTRSTGRQPMPSAPWVYGPWYQADDDDFAELAKFRERDVPVSVLQTYAHYLPCGEQRTEAERTRTAAAHAAGVAITTYFNPMVCQNYAAGFDPAAAAGALTRNQLGQPYLYRYGASPEDSNVVGQFDFFGQAGIDAYGRLLDEAVADGYDGWMEDFGEYTPLDSVSAGGIDGTRAHNPYATRYHCAAFDAVADAPRPINRFQRSGWTGSAPCAQVVWGGDPTTAFGFDGLRSAVTQALSIGLSGISVWGSDVGGFFALGFNRLSPELLTRWVQFGAVSGVMRTQANGVALPSKARPQVIDDDQIANWRRYTKLRTQLYPYLVAAQREYRRSGLPLMRHLALVEPGDPRAVSTDDEFMFGPDLLAAPVTEDAARERSVYLPRGRWVDLWRSAAFEEGGGGLNLGAVIELRGGRDATVPAPLEELPLLARAGSVLPLLPAEVDTLADGGPDGLVGLGERRRELELLAFPRGRSEARFGARGRISSRERGGTWRLAIRGKEAARRFELQASLATLRRPLEPCAVRIDGEELAGRRWSFEPSTGVLEARFRGRSPRLTVSTKGC
ncbi:MAG: TIM-barrel domain-containing protein [Solirubrobacterales bacterium]